MTKADLTHFDYQKVARLDVGMWRSYYNHQFLKLFWQLLILVKTQLGLSWFTTVRLAYYSAWAAADYRINRKNVNNQRVMKSLTKFYKLVSDNAIKSFDYKKTAELELRWWDIHRLSYKNNEELEWSLAEAAAAMYDLDPKKLKRYAHYRAEAMILPRHISDKESFTDWDEVYDLLLKAYKSFYAVIQ